LRSLIFPAQFLSTLVFNADIVVNYFPFSQVQIAHCILLPLKAVLPNVIAFTKN